MNRKRASDSNSIRDIFLAQYEYSSGCLASLKPYSANQIEMLISANSPEDAREVLQHKLITDFTLMYFLFVFSISSNQDKKIFDMYSKSFAAVGTELASLQKACKKAKFNFAEICKSTLELVTSKSLEGRKGKLNFAFEQSISKLAIDLKREYLSELGDENIYNSVREHFIQLGYKI